MLTVQEATKIVGSLSRPSKMPGFAYGLPAKECKVGAALAKIKGSTCAGCYALKGNYMFPNVQNSQYRRLAAITHPLWVEAMVFLISQTATSVFRWHDSGDLQSAEHLERIAEIARRLPEVRFWLPTRELKIVRGLKDCPPNLVIRASAAMIDGKPPEGFANTSIVVKDKAQATCPAPLQGGVCGPCRNCWNPEVKNVSYHKH